MQYMNDTIQFDIQIYQNVNNGIPFVFKMIQLAHNLLRYLTFLNNTF